MVKEIISYTLFLLKYWQSLALRIGTYDAKNEIIAGGPKGIKMRDQIKDDYARLDSND